jgi:hypothetical protein
LIDRKRGSNFVSKFDIDALESKIKAIENQIGEVKQLGEERMLNKLEKSIA